MDENRQQRIEDKLDKVGEDITEIKVTIATNTDSLKEHMRRTEILEKIVEPIHEHMIFVSHTFKIIGGIAAAAGLTAAIVQILEYFHVK